MTRTMAEVCPLVDRGEWPFVDHFHLVAGVIDRVRRPAARAAYAKQAICDKLIELKE